MKLSIVITAYNVEHYIARTLSSLISQTVKQFELIVVDDGSTDSTGQVIKENLQNFKDISCKIITRENGGVSSARNRGLMEAAGQYVMFLDGDDYAADNLVERIYDSLNKQVIDVICWAYNTVDEDKLLLTNYYDIYEHIKKEVTGVEALRNILVDRSMWIWTGSAAFRKDFLCENQLRYTEGCSNGEDQEFSIKVLSKADCVIFIDEILSFYVQRQGSITYSRNIKKFDAISAVKRAVYDLNTADNSELKKIAIIAETQFLVENYFDNLDSCMTGSNIRPLLREINEKYPGLTNEIKKTMSVYRIGKTRFYKYYIKCKLFLISPDLYAVFVFIKRRITCRGKRG